MKNKRRAKGQWRTKRMRNGHGEKEGSLEEKQLSSFPSLPGPKAVQSFLDKSRIWGFFATLLHYKNLFFLKRRTTNSVVAKLVVAAATYYVWQERNWRLFKKGKRSPDQIVECIKSSVRLKLLSCKLKKSNNGERLARLWDLPEAVFK
ncbi:hypothetical protein Tco_1188906 [Tanacetum coccineum]